MSRTTTRLLRRSDLARTAVGRTHHRSRKVSDHDERRAVKHYTHSGGVTTCTRCPPRATTVSELRFCEDCARINKSRHQAGLIRPPGDMTDHANNIINPYVAGKYRGPSFARRFNESVQPVVTAFIERKASGWRRGIASLNGKRIYEGRWTRSNDDAWEYATRSASDVKQALVFESQLADVGVSVD